MSSDPKSQILLRMLDEKRIYIRWTADELLSFGVPFFALFMVERYIEAFLLAAISYLSLRWIKKRFGHEKGILKQAAYRYFGTGKEGLPDSNVTEYLT
ncbi:MAG: hypothetical protein HRT87_06545 [Legionellales bacterium]|nr:hypothetical protein [Legionellales bacterium]